MSDRTASSERILPWRHWWGLAGCAAFMGLVFTFAPYSSDVVFPPDRGAWWYEWQLADATFWTRLAAWLPYTLHQLSIWLLIAHARRARPRYVFGLHRFNVAALAINASALLLHIAQTKLTYDGLAQDVHEATSMMSVVLMLLLVFLMENRRRGLFFGKGIALLDGPGEVVRRYHGYYFSWAIIYTFWYHPVEMTPGHIAGFAYMSLLLLQSSLFFTRFHVNRWWTMFLETLFVVHGALVAYYIMVDGQGGPWHMFLFGGVAVFLITQLHGLGLGTRGKLAIALPLLAAMVVFYSSYPDQLVGVTRLPMIMYAGTMVMAMLVWILSSIGRWLVRAAATPRAPGAVH